MKNLWISLPLLVCSTTLPSQTAQHKAPARVTGTAQAPDVNALNVSELTYQRDVQRIYWGDFDRIRLDPNSLAISIMGDTFMRYYGVACDRSLPANKVMIMNAECNGWSHQVYVQTGIEVPGSLTCDSYKEVPSGIYADPDLLRAQKAQSARAALAVFGSVGSVLTKSGDAGISAALGMNVHNLDVVRQAKDLAPDMKKLIGMNTCGNPAIRRFSQNLTAYLAGTQPVRMAGIPVAPAFRDSDYQTLLDDLVADQSRAWLINQFQRNSVANVVVSARDSLGRPATVSARYAFVGMSKPGEGSLELRFHNGMPECITYADLPDACRVIAPGVVTAYEDGKYVTDRPAAARTYTAPDLRQVNVTIDTSLPVTVQVPGSALNLRPGIVLPARGTLTSDVMAKGPGGSVVMARAGSPVMLTVLNSQRSVRINLIRANADTPQVLDFHGTYKELMPGVDLPARDGTPFTVSFTLAPGTERMPMAEFEKRKTPGGEVSAPAVATPVAGMPGRAPAPSTMGRVMMAGTQLHLQFAGSVTAAEVGSGKVLPAVVVAMRSAVLNRGETLPEGTTVYLRVAPGNGREFRIEGDHVVLGGANVPLETNSLVRIAIPARPAPGVRIGPYQIPLQNTGGMTIVPGGAVINLTVRNNVALDGGAR